MYLLSIAPPPFQQASHEELCNALATFEEPHLYPHASDELVSSETLSRAGIQQGDPPGLEAWSRLFAWQAGAMLGPRSATGVQRGSQMRIPLDMDDMEPTPPQTASARERGFASDANSAEYGKSDELDGEDAGDIADEGPGHRA